MEENEKMNKHLKENIKILKETIYLQRKVISLLQEKLKKSNLETFVSEQPFTYTYANSSDDGEEITTGGS